MENKKLIISGFLLIFVATAILLIINLKGAVNPYVINEDDAREIIIDAKRFEYSPDVVRIKEGEKIKLSVNNLDGEHGFSIPELGLEVHDEKGVIFVADKKGTFGFYCHHYCGSGHSNMKGVLIVE